MTLETLLKDKDHIKIIKDLISGSGRSHPSEEKSAIPEKMKQVLVLSATN